MVYKIYGTPQSSQLVLTTLKEKGLEYELIMTYFIDMKQQPFGVSPVLDDDGFLIYESRAICRYLEAKHRDQGTVLIPSDPQALGLFEQGASIEISYFNLNANALTFETSFMGQYATVNEARVKQFSEKLSETLDVYEKILAKQEYIGGNQFTLADLFHLQYGSMLFSRRVSFGNLITDRPHVKEWWEKISSRPSWKAVSDELMEKPVSTQR